MGGINKNPILHMHIIAIISLLIWKMKSRRLSHDQLIEHYGNKEIHRKTFNTKNQPIILVQNMNKSRYIKLSFICILLEFYLIYPLRLYGRQILDLSWGGPTKDTQWISKVKMKN